MSWLRAHRRALLLAIRRLAAAPLNTLLAMLGFGIALALPAGGYVMLSHVAALAQGRPATPQLTVFLAVEADRKTAEALAARLKADPAVARTQLPALPGPAETAALLAIAAALGWLGAILSISQHLKNME